jgi:hypothetical protein
MDPERRIAVDLAPDVVVVAAAPAGALRGDAEALAEDRHDAGRDRLSVEVRERERPRQIAEAGGARCAVRVEAAQPPTARRRPAQVMIADRLAHRARARVDHHPERAGIVGLQLEEVVATPQRAQLEPAEVARHGVERGMRQPSEGGWQRRRVAHAVA